MKDIERVVDSFPHPIINPIIRISTYQTLAEVKLKLNANTSSVNLEFVNGQLRLLSLTVIATVYLALEGVSFIPPVNPPQIVIPRV